MLPNPRLLKHHQYFLPDSSTELAHSGRTHLADFEEYHQRLAALHHAYLHGWGVIHGLEVALEPATPSALRIEPGLAVDRTGQLIVLSAQAGSLAYVGEAQEEIEPPFVIHTTDLSPSRTYNLTIRVVAELPEDQVEFLPWLEFSLADEPPPEVVDGVVVVLAVVSLDEQRNIVALESENAAFGHRRHLLLTEGVEAIRLQRPVVTGGTVQSQAVAGIQAEGNGTLRVTMASDEGSITLAHAQDGNFRRLDVRANTTLLNGGVGIGTEPPAAGLQVAGDLRANSGLQVNGQTTLAAGLQVAGAIQGNNSLQVAGATRLLGGTETNTLRVTGDLTLEGNLAVAGTVSGRHLADDGAALDAHLAAQANPHQVTAAQVGALAVGGGNISGSLMVAGNVGIGTTAPQSPLHIADHMTVGPFAATRGVGGIDVTGPLAELGFVRRTLTAWPSTPAAGDRFVWYNPDGTARLWTERNGDLLTISNDGNLSFGARVRQMINLWRTEYGIGVQGWTQYFRTHGNFAWYRDGSHHDSELNGGGGVLQMVIRRNDRVGIGTADPSGSLHISTPHNYHTPQLKVTQRTNNDWARIVMESAGNEFHLSVGGPRSSTPNVFHVWSQSSRRNVLTVSHRNHVGILHENPGHPLHMGGGAYCEGGRIWRDASSIAYKDDVVDLSLAKALETLAGLHPVTFRYKEEAAHANHAGFIAEDVPDLVASVDRKGLSALELVSVLTKVVQHQQEEIINLKKKLS